jgi:hypothetical protein
MHDFINFKSMSGNEILLNMNNAEYFRNTELVSCLNEFSKRLYKKENQEFKEKEVDLTNHPYISKVLSIYQKKILGLNVKIYLIIFS